MSTTPVFRLRFIVNANSTRDSTLEIRPAAFGGFTWTYDDVATPSKEVMDISVMEAAEARLETLFDLLALDDDPYESVQVDVPGMPGILIDMENLDDTKHAVLRAFRQVSVTWPYYVRAQQPAKKASTKLPAKRRLSTVSESTDEDMPPLVPQSSSWSTNGYNTYTRF